jgi:hypothetical protein
MDANARLPGVVPSAWLRVFQPLDAFDAHEQAHWERYLVMRTRSPSVRLRYADRPLTGKLGVMSPAGAEHAEVRVLDGKTYVSPWRLRLRVLAATLSFAETEPLELADSFVPKAEVRRARRELGRLRRRNPGAIAFGHESPWHVPIRWFVFFDDAERRLREDEFGRNRLGYVTTVRKAMRRAERVIPVLRRTDLGPISELILDLHQWMVSFDHLSLLELDYGSLCDLLTWDELDDDHSVRELHEALEALEAGEFVRSADIYQGVLGRWAEVRGRETLN